MNWRLMGVLSSLLALPLVLTACPKVDPGSICPQSTPGLSLVGLSVPAPAEVVTPAVNWAAPRVPGQLLVSTGTVSSGLSAQALGALSGVRTQAVTSDLTLAFTPAGQSDQVFAEQLRAQGLTVQPNFRYRALALPNDPGVPGNTGISVLGFNVNQAYLSRVKVPEAWTFLQGCGKTPVGAKVALVDSGVDDTVTELSGRLSAKVSYIGSALHTYDHGTATTGLISAKTNNGVGLAGVTWSGPVVTAEVLDGTGYGTTADVVQALAYAVQQGAKVINLSLGGAEDPANPGDAQLDAALSSAAQSAVLVGAAGNRADEGVYYPASHPAVIAVGAVGTSDSELACYSARPSAELPRALDMVAPGGAGYGACSGATPAQDLLLLAPGNGYALEAGTSFSAPLVSGVAALMRAANPNLTAAQTKALLLSTAASSGGLPLLDANAAIRAATR